MRNIGLYIHIPFCQSKCYYCDFTSYVGQMEKAERYVDCVVKEAREQTKTWGEMMADTVYLGGGTPSLLSEKSLERLVEGIACYIPIKPGGEFTIEANPGTLTQSKGRLYEKLGINRVSLGMQSADGALLQQLGRKHSPEDVKIAVDVLHTAGIQNISVDIMYGLPGQTLEQLEQTLEEAVHLGVQHVSAYGLKVEEQTMFARWKKEGKLTLPEEELELQMEELICRYLAERGFARYEISNYARPGFESRHNLKYWDLEDYLGLGVGAHSYLTGVPNVRFANGTRLGEYLACLEGENAGYAPEQVDQLTEMEDVEEYIMLQLRKTMGMDLGDFTRRFGRRYVEKIIPSMGLLKKNGLAVEEGDRFFLTRRGLAVQNAAVVELIRNF